MGECSYWLLKYDTLPVQRHYPYSIFCRQDLGIIENRNGANRAWHAGKLNVVNSVYSKFVQQGIALKQLKHYFFHTLHCSGVLS